VTRVVPAVPAAIQLPLTVALSIAKTEKKFCEYARLVTFEFAPMIETSR
jgi:hypothetical protein